ncbi:Tetratricopeptide TPR_2 repeat protein [Methylobacterium sp. 4-46]|uniref:tetratricopeptide repeat protein n=1 Tax=unclassified Methylobacterium TaxID=2615210 RepID=UPI000165C6D9|nr:MULTISPECIES: tetratricopeptide repeat protein [Methylobacterium]ACA15904.1 Tetratricopeptide TPR_2 repeat protein [Methylobacterium sp. 4-46]WFT81621.1 tetratricopeptide repeat protein [Methylobacterium nodulans]
MEAVLPAIRPRRRPRPGSAARALAVAGALAALGLLAVPRASLGRALLAAGLPGLAVRVADDPGWRGTALYAAGRYREAAEAFGQARGRAAAYNRGNALAMAGDLDGALKAYEALLARDPGNEDARANRDLVARLLDEHLTLGQQAAGEANARADQTTRYDAKATSDENDPGNASFGEGLAGNREASAAADAPGTSKASRTGKAEQRAVDPGRGRARGSASDAEGGGRSGAGLASVSQVVEREVRRVSKSFEAKEIRADRHWLATMTDDPGRFLKRRLEAEHLRRQEAGSAVQPGSNPW